MNANTPMPWLDPDFQENQRKFPTEELLRYAGQHIAWSWDGAQSSQAIQIDARSMKSYAPLGLIRCTSSTISLKIPT